MSAKRTTKAKWKPKMDYATAYEPSAYFGGSSPRVLNTEILITVYAVMCPTCCRREEERISVGDAANMLEIISTIKSRVLGRLAH